MVTPVPTGGGVWGIAVAILAVLAVAWFWSPVNGVVPLLFITSSALG